MIYAAWCQKWDEMASLNLQPTSAFDFCTPDEWPRWKQRFEQFCIASGLSAEGGEKQVSVLLYCMGKDTEGMLRSIRITPDEKKHYQTVVDKFDAFIQVRQNVIFERAKFNCRIQEENETIEQFIPASTTWLRLVITGT